MKARTNEVPAVEAREDEGRAAEHRVTEPASDTQLAPDLPIEIAAQPIAIDFAVAESPVPQPPATHNVPAILDSDLAPGTRDASIPEPAHGAGSDEVYPSTSPIPDIEDDAVGRSRGSTVSSQARPITPPATFTRTTPSVKTSIAPSAEHGAPIVVIDPSHGNPSISSIRCAPFSDNLGL